MGFFRFEVRENIRAHVVLFLHLRSPIQKDGERRGIYNSPSMTVAP